MPPEPREPVVIEILDGETVPVKVVSGARFAPLSLNMEQIDYAMPYLRISGRTRSALFGLEPDPVRAAVLAERERCKAIARRELGGRAELRDRDRLLAALDAGADEVSDHDAGYTKGATHVRQLSAQIAYDKRLTAIDCGKLACREIEVAIRNISTEPPQ